MNGINYYVGLHSSFSLFDFYLCSLRFVEREMRLSSSQSVLFSRGREIELVLSVGENLPCRISQMFLHRLLMLILCVSVRSKSSLILSFNVLVN